MGSSNGKTMEPVSSGVLGLDEILGRRDTACRYPSASPILVYHAPVVLVRPSPSYLTCKESASSNFCPWKRALRRKSSIRFYIPVKWNFRNIKGILKRVEEVQPKRIVFDSLSERRLLAREPLRFRRQLPALKQYFAGRDSTVLLLDDHTAGERERDIQSIVHGVVRLGNLQREYGAKRRRLEVLKLRGVQFREGFHDYNIRTGGLETYPRGRPACDALSQRTATHSRL
jgi:hypothetical protein